MAGNQNSNTASGQFLNRGRKRAEETSVAIAKNSMTKPKKPTGKTGGLLKKIRKEGNDDLRTIRQEWRGKRDRAPPGQGALAEPFADKQTGVSAIKIKRSWLGWQRPTLPRLKTKYHRR